jgi:polysaccharide biosynthesis/export protein
MVPMNRPSPARHPLRLGLLLLLLGLVAGCKGAPPAEGGPVGDRLQGFAELAAPGPTRATLAPDDLLRIVVYGHPDLSSAETGQRVDYQGRVNLPLIGTVAVAGLTVEQARRAIEERAARLLRHASVSLAILEYAPRICHILGEVQLSGAYDLDRPVTALQALALGGGFTEGADREQIAHLRVEKGELIVRFFDGATPGVDGLIAMLPGDLIFVRQSGSGTFRDQILPYVQGVSQPLSAIASLILVVDRLDR